MTSAEEGLPPRKGFMGRTPGGKELLTLKKVPEGAGSGNYVETKALSRSAVALNWGCNESRNNVSGGCNRWEQYPCQDYVNSHPS